MLSKTMKLAGNQKVTSIACLRMSCFKLLNILRKYENEDEKQRQDGITRRHSCYYYTRFRPYSYSMLLRLHLYKDIVRPSEYVGQLPCILLYVENYIDFKCVKTRTRMYFNGRKRRLVSSKSINKDLKHIGL